MNNIETYKFCNGCHNCKYLLENYDVESFDSSYFCNLGSNYPSKVYSGDFENEEDEQNWKTFSATKRVKLYGKCSNWQKK